MFASLISCISHLVWVFIVQSIEDIVGSNPTFIRNILLDCLPFEGTDPLCAGKSKSKLSTTTATIVSKEHGSAAISSVEMGNSSSSKGIIDPKTRHQEEQSCTSLAVRIIKLAKLKLKKDVELQFQEKSLLESFSDTKR